MTESDTAALAEDHESWRTREPLQGLHPYHQPKNTETCTADRTPKRTAWGLAVLLHQRLGLPQVAIARLFGVTPETVHRRIRDARHFQAAGHTIDLAGPRIADLGALHDLLASHGITITTEIKTAD